MTDLVFPSPTLALLLEQLRAPEVESAAIGLGSRVAGHDRVRVLVRDILIPRPQDYARRTAVDIELDPEFFGSVVSQSRIDERTLVLIHSHPRERRVPQFSSIDDRSEKIMLPYLLKRGGPGPPIALLVGADAIAARVVGTKEAVRVLQSGPRLEIRTSTRHALSNVGGEFDRQVRAFGPEGQARLADLTVAIVGLGGTGSVIAEQLAHLGVSHFMLVDPDVLEETNLNRVVGSTRDDVGLKKVDIAARRISEIRHRATVIAIDRSVNDRSVSRGLAEVDFIFGCTDGHGSRAVLAQLAYQYLVPVIDVGVVIVVRDGEVRSVAGRVQMLAPGLGCFVCGDQLDPHAVRREFQSEMERTADPYFIGHGTPQPAVISINSTVSSLAVTMCLSAVLGVPAPSRYLWYDALAGTLRSTVQAPQARCVVCSRDGSLARGDEWPLPGESA